jgi:Fur family ferric uptake transcriptional regulator
MSNNEERLNTQQLKDAGLKVTLPRMKVLHILESGENQHYSAEMIYKTLIAQGEEVGLATIYRVLTQFESANIVKRHNFEGGHAVYEIAAAEHHDHLVCVKCNKVEEFLDETIEAQQEVVAKNANFKIIDHSLNLYGVCGECQTNKQS